MVNDLLDTYTVRCDGNHLRVERRDGRDGISWDDLQALKDEYLGSEVLAIEIYPPADQVVNEICARHLWAINATLDGFGRLRFNGA